MKRDIKIYLCVLIGGYTTFLRGTLQHIIDKDNRSYLEYCCFRILVVRCFGGTAFIFAEKSGKEGKVYSF